MKIVPNYYKENHMVKIFSKLTMKIAYIVKFLFIFFVLYSTLTEQAFSQKKIKGTVIDLGNKPVKNLQIKIIHCNITNSGLRGSFTVQPRKEITNLTPADIRVLGKAPWLVKEVKFFANSGNLQIIVQPAGKLKGALIFADGKGRNGHHVVLEGANENAPSITDTKGSFEINYPKGLKIGEDNSFRVDGFQVPAENINFQQNNTFVQIIYAGEAESPELSTVLIRSVTGQVIPKVLVSIQDKAYLTDNKGVFIPEDMSEIEGDSLIEIDDYKFIRRSSDESSGQVVLVFKPLFEDTTKTLTTASQVEFIPPSTSIEDDFNSITNSLIDDRNEQIRRSKRFELDLESLTDRLLSENTFTPTQRQVFKSYISNLEETFKLNDSIYNRWNQDAQAQLYEMQLAVYEKDSLKSLAEKKVEIVETEKKKLEAEKKLTELRFRDNMIILSIIIFVLLTLAVIFYRYNRVISRKNNELQVTRDALADKVEEVNQRNEEIRAQRDNIADKNKQIEKAFTQIKSSIFSAERIQNAILDKPSEILRHFEAGFIYFAPRDIVSGDFYWYTQVGGEVIIAAVDCTGHGVPGAFMTMLGNSLLNQIVIENRITDPAEILQQLDEKVKETLHQKERSSASDGMDMTVLNYNKYSNKIIFSGAKNPLYYIKDKELIQVKGTNMPIGGTQPKKKYTFESHEISLTGGETFYMQSDGFQDQFGGTGGYGKKFMKSKYKKLLLEIHQLPMSEQYNQIKSSLNQWKGEYSQTDDILVIGLKV